MYKEVNNNVAGAVKVIADASYTSIRYAFFPAATMKIVTPGKALSATKTAMLVICGYGLLNAICLKQPGRKLL